MNLSIETPLKINKSVSKYFDHNSILCWARKYTNPNWKIKIKLRSLGSFKYKKSPLSRACQFTSLGGKLRKVSLQLSLPVLATHSLQLWFSSLLIKEWNYTYCHLLLRYSRLTSTILESVSSQVKNPVFRRDGVLFSNKPNVQ